ncbi:hypothetical protein IFR04_002257 [Cadophora malorum]|uniref:Uncharacterized protein n=1 Tax=Cadophora malorum TaxID=108018 RepID=A0A8H7WGU5_9HELO|nr:hypothetical protein IFR04_002257 [Cadophora malorum]
MELLIMSEIMGSTFSADYKNREMRPWYTFFILTLVILVAILAEICLFANSHLGVNKWLVLQIFKLAFAATVFGIYVGCAGRPGQGSHRRGSCTPQLGNWRTWEEVREMLGGLVGFWTPWIAGLVCGILAKFQDGKQRKEELVVEEEVRRPLLPRRISPSERRAVYR